MAIHSAASGTNRWFAGGASALDNFMDGGGTIMCWAWHDVEASGAQSYMVDKGQTIFLFQQHASGNNRLRFTRNFDTTNGIWFTPFPADVPQGVWNHLAVRYNADDVANDPRFCVNGVDGGIEEAQAPVGTRLTNVTAASVGGSGTSPGLHFQEDLRFYDRELTDGEIETIATLRGHDNIIDGLLARYLQNEGAEGVVVPLTAGFIKDLGPDALNGVNSASNPTFEAGQLTTRRRVA